MAYEYTQTWIYEHSSLWAVLIFWALCMSIAHAWYLFQRLSMIYAHTMINGFIIDKLCYIISSIAFIMTPISQSRCAQRSNANSWFPKRTGNAVLKIEMHMICSSPASSVIPWYFYLALESNDPSISADYWVSHLYKQISFQIGREGEHSLTDS